MNISQIQHGPMTVVQLQDKRLDAAMAVNFKEAMREISESSADQVLLDMSNVTFMDSSGLGAIVAVMKLMGREKSFEIAELTPPVLKVFILTRMDSVFKIHPSVDEGLAHLVRDTG